MEDLEDDLGDQVQPAQPVLDLFGDDDEAPAPAHDDYRQYEDDLEDDIPEPAPQPAPAAAAPVTAEDRRAALMKLAQKKKREAEGGDDRRKKKKKRDGEKEGRSKGKDKDGEPSRPRREKPSKSSDKPARTGGADEPELPSDELEETAADDDFIDDEGVEPAYDVEGGDDDEGTAGLLLPPEEAVEVARGEEDEADDAEDLFGRKKRKKNRDSEQQMAMVVDDKIAKMEAAAEADMEQHEQARPAIHKLKCLAEMEEFLAQKKYHELFVSAGGLGVLKAWLEPYSDGSLPNTRVRTAVLKACKLLPIDTSREDMKSQLKKSQLGNRVMFLLKCQDETPSNRQLARDLVQQWSRPIFYDPAAEAAKQKIREQQLKIARAAAVAASKEVEKQQAAVQRPSKIKFGESGYRWHASIPQASKLDYVVEPKQDERVNMTQAAVAAAHVPANSSRFAKKMREVQRKQKSTTARAAKPSVEGRTITLMK